MKSLLAVINPISGGTDKAYLRDELEAEAEERSWEINFYETEGEDDRSKLKKILSQVDCDVMVVCGGDGTVHLVADIALEYKLPLAIYPAGSANGLATELQLDEDVAELFDLIDRDKMLKMDVLTVNDHKCLHFSDIGFNARLIERFEEGKFRGMLGYFRYFVETMWHHQPSKFQLVYNGQEIEVKALAIVFANARLLGTGAIINPSGQLDDGKFELCIFKPYPWYAALGLAFRFFSGGIKESPYVEIKEVTEVSLQCEEEELCQVDGELVGKYRAIKSALYDEQLKVYSSLYDS